MQESGAVNPTAGEAEGVGSYASAEREGQGKIGLGVAESVGRP